MSIDGQNGKGNAHDWVFKAMALHKSRRAGADEALARSKAIFAETPPATWQDRVELTVLIEEAEELLKRQPR